MDWWRVRVADHTDGKSDAVEDVEVITVTAETSDEAREEAARISSWEIPHAKEPKKLEDKE